MALVIQTEVSVGSYIPYERPPQPFTLWTAIPRGLQSFIVDGLALDAISVGDDALLNITAVLPPNFGYVMNDCNLTLAQEGAGANWDGNFNLNLQNFYRAPGLSLGLSGNWVQDMVNAAQDGSTKNSSIVQPWPSFPIIGTEGTSGIQVVVSTFNNAGVAQLVGTIQFFLSFWQFDLEQIRKYPINSPAPTHAR